MEKNAKDLTTTILYYITNCPDTVYGGGPEIYYCYVFEEGRLKEILFENKEDAEFKTTTNYDYLAKIVQGEVTPLQALTSGNIIFEGDNIKAMKLMKATNTFLKVLQSIEVEY